MFLKQCLLKFGYVMRIEELKKQSCSVKWKGVEREIENALDVLKKLLSHLQELKEFVRHRNCWRQFIHEVTRSRPRLDST